MKTATATTSRQMKFKNLTRKCIAELFLLEVEALALAPELKVPTFVVVVTVVTAPGSVVPSIVVP
jgi:hypothetical protein